MARDGEISICIGRGGDESYITFADGKRATVYNNGIVVLPPAPPSPAMALIPESTVPAGVGRALSVDGETLELRFHRDPRRLQGLYGATKNAPSVGWLP